MSLYAVAASDLARILTANRGGFGVPITLTSPEENSQILTGRISDIGRFIDPSTGEAIAGRKVTVFLSTPQINIGIPTGDILDDEKPWLVTFAAPPSVQENTYRIVDTAPDSLGIVICNCEIYEC